MNDLLASVERTMRGTFNRDPEWRLLVPGRLEVFGKHTDYAGGRSLVAAVPRGFAFAVSGASDGSVDVLDAVSGARVSCRIGGREPAGSGWSRYVTTVVRRLTLNFPSAELSSRIVLGSNLASAAGISTSSALVVGIAEALIARGGLDRTREWQHTIHGDEDRAAYFGCLENGSSFGAFAGDEGVGTHGGSEDHAAIVMGRRGVLLQCSFSPLRCQRRIPMPPGWTFVVVSSGVRANKTGRARQDYNRLAAEAAAIRDGAPLTPRLANRLAHLHAEDARVPEAADAFEQGDVARIGELSAASQTDAEHLLGNQIPETVALASMARECGAAAASAFGAGWGGSVWALVRSEGADTFLGEWLASYKTRYPHRDAVGFVSPPSDGLHRL